MATITCDNCTETEVWNKIATAATAGDTVVLPNNRPTGGTFTLTYAGQTTAAIAYNAAGSEVKTALENLSNIGTGDITVDDTGEFQWRITFSGSLGFTDLALMTATSSVTPATGRNVTVLELVKGVASPPSAVRNEIQVVRIGSLWSSSHILTKAIKLEGAGIDNTIILDGKSTTYWIRFDLVDNELTEITGISFKNGTSTGSGSIDANSTLRFVGNSTSSYQLRVHDCKFEELPQWPVFCTQVRGVFDHNEFVRCDGGGAYIYGLTWKSDPPSGSPAFGDGSWAFPTDAGGMDTGEANATYFENNFFDQTNSVYDKTFFDGTRGGRGVVRYNTIKQASENNAAIVTCHGLENRNRSIRHFEFYNNYVISGTITNKLVNQRGGTVVVFNNRVSGGASMFMPFQADRECDPQFWGRASGSNPVDVNDANGGTNDDPNPFYEGEMTTGTTTDHVVVLGSPGWADDLWIGYSLSDLNLTWPTGVGRQEIQYVGGVIIDSGPNWIDTGASVYSNPHNYASGHSFKIQRCLHAMDQIGRAGTSVDNLVSGGAVAANPPVYPAGWNNQETEPLYGWNNIQLPSTAIMFTSDAHPMIRSGVHYIASNTTVKPGYPWTASVDTICGAEDYTNVPLAGSATNGKGGFTYPHPLIEAPTGSKIIDVPIFRDFGNVIVGENTTYDIPVQNLGDTTLDVSGVTDPNVYVVAAPLNFSVGAGATVLKTVTFSPVAAQSYSGDIIFASDATEGNGTMNVTGAGVTGGGGGGHGKGHKKGALSRRA